MIRPEKLSPQDREIYAEYSRDGYRLSSDGLLYMADNATDPELKELLQDAAHWAFKTEEARVFGV